MTEISVSWPDLKLTACTRGLRAGEEKSPESTPALARGMLRSGEGLGRFGMLVAAGFYVSPSPPIPMGRGTAAISSRGAH